MIEQRKFRLLENNSMTTTPVDIDYEAMTINGIRVGQIVYFNEINPTTGQIARRVTGSLMSFTQNGAVFVEEKQEYATKKGLHVKKILHMLNHKDIKVVPK